ncbi:MAG: hypothetical protein K2Q01_11550 [Rickettsiales bacterium]|nr:hypothetical protein [Rickettsiales bacterium]
MADEDDKPSIKDLQTEVVRQKDEQGRERANGSTLVGVSGTQARLDAVIAKLSGMGLSAAGKDLASAKTDGMTEGEAQALMDAAAAAERNAEGQLLMAQTGKAIASAIGIGGGQEVSESNFNLLNNGLQGLLLGGNDRNRGGGMGGVA